MNPISRIVDFFLWNKEDRDEERRWQASGSYPDVVERDYRKQRDFQRDAARLKAMGYRVANVGRDELSTGDVIIPRVEEMQEDVGDLIRVRYEGQGDSRMSPGAESANNADPPETSDLK